MSLVAYDSSDDEKDEEIVTSQPSQIIKPKNATAKRQRECVKITIPSLKEFEEETNPVALKKQKFQSGSGLFSLLPPPKNSSISKKPGFIPYVLSSKKSKNDTSTPPKCTTKSTETKSVDSGVLDQQNYDETYCNEESSKDEANSASCKDFFSLDGLSSENKLDDKSHLSPDYCLETDPSSDTLEDSSIIQNRSSSMLSSNHTHQRNEKVENLHIQPCHSSQNEFANSEQVTLMQGEQLDMPLNACADHPMSNSHRESLLSDKEFLKLQGRRREFEAVDIIDVNADDQLTDRNEWLMKSLTEESTHRPSRKKHNMPTQQQKRKHQITYLAFQAKEREMDLKNQWALNSRTRRETQAKYGF